jgi:toxin ParE1/3/4
MTRRFHVLPAADRDLDDQAAYLAMEASLETALRFYDAARSTFGEIECRASANAGPLRAHA